MLREGNLGKSLTYVISYSRTITCFLNVSETRCGLKVIRSRERKMKIGDVSTANREKERDKHTHNNPALLPWVCKTPTVVQEIQHLTCTVDVYTRIRVRFASIDTQEWKARECGS